ncbi:MAG: hypothetical protein F6J97_20620 [Leptolyngbya sp. SIO4C1]|nr:hypothetical protein [Leptolyngbya sp. SIO4C1]
MAIAVIAITTAVIAPVMLVSVATRVQSQRAEQALQVAQGEIDRVRLVVERNATYGDPELGIASVPSTTTTELTQVSFPTAVQASYDLAQPRVSKGIDIDSDGTNDFAVQTFRMEGEPDTAGRPVSFDLGVRVYPYAAVESGRANTIEPVRIGLSSSNVNDNIEGPLVVLYTKITKSDESNSLCEYIDELGVPAGSSTPTKC